MSIGYFFNQSTKFLWYSAHYIISFKYSTPIKIDKTNPPSFYGKMPSGKQMFFEMMKLLNEERKLINSKFYKIPKTQLKDLLSAAKGSFDFFLDLPKIDKRRASGKFSEVDTKKKDLPKYYLRNFHYQTDGYLSEKSARLYEFQVETLFTGCAATMRRFSMIPLINYLNSNKKNIKLLDIGTGTGEIIESYTLNFKNTEITCSDLSEEYLNVAKQKLKKFKDIKYVNCKGEELPFENESFDVLTSTYMFHEIPTEIRKQVFSEISRVLKKDGIFVLTDSLQIDDNPKLNPLLEFFPYSTHEPFYPKYIREDLKEVAKNYGLEMYYNKNAYLSKSMAFRKL
ncbi:methyltransferase domain-containing protein [Candidatus Pelagibacter sp.]|nr:methyltransferase domain-containing protein [Candidatus Pelagibacter sp.]